jgi:hypothetical protein
MVWVPPPIFGARDFPFSLFCGRDIPPLGERCCGDLRQMLVLGDSKHLLLC